jgi:hypothetical protein
MNKMRHSSHRLRIALLAGASVLALVAAAPNAGAADMSAPMAKKAPPPAAIVKERWSWWIEGGAVDPSGDSFNFGPRLSSIKPKWGWEGAAGFDWMPGWGPWHVSGQFRYGSAQKTQGFNSFGAGFEHIVLPVGTTFVGTITNNEKIRDEHWVVDFAIGRDFGLGNANAQWKLGLRVVDLRARLTAGGITNTTGASVRNITFNTQQNATFVGAGPRLGVEGSTPLAAGWSFDWLAGAAVLIGERHTSQTNLAAFPASLGGAVLLTGQATENTAAVFNVDAQAGLSYWLNPNLKITASYRVDAYFNALKTIKAGTANNSFVDVDQIFNGPMLRLTSTW